MKAKYIVTNSFFTVAINSATGREIGLLVDHKPFGGEVPMVFSTIDAAKRKALSFNRHLDIVATTGFLKVVAIS